MSATQTSSIETRMPGELLQAAHRLSGELAWPAAEARQVVSWLGGQGCEVAGVELWRDKDGHPQWVASSDFSPASADLITAESIDRCVRMASQFIYRYQEEPGALFNLTWLEPNTGKFDRYARVRLETDIYRAEGASKGDLGYIIEVYPGGYYEVEFFHPDGTTFALITAREIDIQQDEPSTLPLTHLENVLTESRNKQPLIKAG